MADREFPDASGLPAAKMARWYWGVFAFALALRALHLWQISEAPFFPLLMGDAEGYDFWARRIAAGDWLGSEVFYQAPLYPYFLATVYALLGEAPALVKLCQAVLGGISSVLLVSAGARFFSKPVGITAGLLSAIYAPSLFFEGLIQKSALDFFFVCLVLWWIALLQGVDRRAYWLALGASLGCLTLTRENALLLCVPILAWALLYGSVSGWRRLLPALWIALGVATLLLPVALRNFAVGGEAHLTTSQFGANFYIGNNENATGSYRPLRYGRGTWEHEREDATRLAEAAVGRSLSPAEVSSYWTGRALDYIHEHPLDWLALLLRKLQLLVNRAELVDTEDQYTHAEWSWPLRASGAVLHFGVIAPLALLGVAVSWKRRKELWLLLLLPVVYAISVAAFYVFARYRYPLVPFLVLFAAVGIVGLGTFVRERSWITIAMVSSLVLAAALICNWPIGSEARMRSATHRNMGVLLASQGQDDAAREQFQRALEHDPDNVLAHHSLGALLQTQGELEGAERAYRAALARKPDHAPSHAKLGIVRSQQGQLEEALVQYRRALALDPDLALAHENLALTLILLGRPGRAHPHLKEAVRLDPAVRDRLARRALNLASSDSGGPRAAIEAMRLARLASELGQSPSAIALDALAAAHAANGQPRQAVDVCESALRVAASDPTVGEQLEAEMRERLAHYQKVLETR